MPQRLALKRCVEPCASSAAICVQYASRLLLPTPRGRPSEYQSKVLAKHENRANELVTKLLVVR